MTGICDRVFTLFTGDDVDSVKPSANWRCQREAGHNGWHTHSDHEVGTIVTWIVGGVWEIRGSPAPTVDSTASGKPKLTVVRSGPQP